MAKRVKSSPTKRVADATRAVADGRLSEDDVHDSTPACKPLGRMEELRMGEGDDRDTLYFEMISKVYTGIQEQIRFADTKAGFVAAFNAILIGFIANNLGVIKDLYKTTHDRDACLWLMVVSLFTCIPTAISIGFLIRAVRPRLGQNTHRSLIFFGHIARDYHLDGVRYRKDARAMGQVDWSDDYSYQIVEVANIAQQKHMNVRVSMNWSFWAFVALVVISLIVHVISVLYLPITV